LIYEVTDKTGDTSTTSTHEEKLKLKYYYENDLQEALGKAGLKIQEKFGWYDKSSVAEGNRELIFVCGK
jgi:hypothetical protein